MAVRDSSMNSRAGKILKNRKGKQPISLASKITTSAAMLAREMAGSSNASEISDMLSNSSTLGRKISNGLSTDSSRWMEELPIRSTNPYGPAGSSHANFRSSPVEESADTEFESFLSSPASLLHILPDDSESYDRSPWTKVTSLDIVNQLSTRSSDAHNLEIEQFHTEEKAHLVAFLSEATDTSEISVSTTTHTHLPATDQEQFDGLALMRLKLIAGHLAQTSSSSLQFYKSNQDVHGRELGVTSHADQKLSYRKPGFAQDTTRTDQNSAQYFQPSRQQGSAARQESEEEGTVSDFHCPWIRCHQRFRNPGELQRHSDSHTEYACPHEDCPVLCESRAVWAAHVVEPHHDLLDSTTQTVTNPEAEAME